MLLPFFLTRQDFIPLKAESRRWWRQLWIIHHWDLHLYEEIQGQHISVCGLFYAPNLHALEQLAPWEYEQEVGSWGRKAGKKNASSSVYLCQACVTRISERRIASRRFLGLRNDKNRPGPFLLEQKKVIIWVSRTFFLTNSSYCDPKAAKHWKVLKMQCPQTCMKLLCGGWFFF